MEHFEGCKNKECIAYWKDGQCKFRYGDKIPKELRSCEHLKELLSKEKHCDMNGFK